MLDGCMFLLFSGWSVLILCFFHPSLFRVVDTYYRWLLSGGMGGLVVVFLEYAQYGNVSQREVTSFANTLKKREIYLLFHPT